jgi:hypothetical protein
MSIDFREYYAGQCFGVIANTKEATSAEIFGAELDEELDAELDSELFGAEGRDKRQMAKLKRTMKRFSNMHSNLRHAHRKTKATNSAGAAFRMKRLKHRLGKVGHKIIAIWKNLSEDAKVEWAKVHGEDMVPGAFFRRHNIQKFQ